MCRMSVYEEVNNVYMLCKLEEENMDLLRKEKKMYI